MEKERPRIEALFKAAIEAASKFVETHAVAIHAVAEELISRRRLSGEEVTSILVSVGSDRVEE